jgi:hypothetical protein
MKILTIIEDNCKTLAEQRAQLRRRYEAKLKAMLAVNAEHDEAIRRLQADCTVTRAALLAQLETGREFFKKKERGTVTMPEETILVDRIAKLLPAAQAETVLDRSVSLIKAAFKKLPRETLQKLGCSIVSGADRPIVHANDDDIEALVHKTVGEAAP